jgi:hypothetical protein
MSNYQESFTTSGASSDETAQVYTNTQYPYEVTASSGYNSSSYAESRNVNQIVSDVLSSQTIRETNSNTYFAGNSSSSSNAFSSPYFSDIESAVIRSQQPIESNETEEITVNGQRGIWLNRAEVINWRGSLPISDYPINQDEHPEMITKRASHNVEYVQELAIRYLRPPTPEQPGDIIITQEANIHTAPAPPLVIRQQPPRPATPEPIVVREAPPQPPPQAGRKLITISGKRLPPPPRKVIIERLAPIPTKPQSIIIERWLPYNLPKRRVIFQRSGERDSTVVAPKNVIVQWEAPTVSVKKEVKYLGVVRANPLEYVERYGSTLKTSRDLPEFVYDIKAPEGISLASDHHHHRACHELEGDIHALKLIDLDREGLGEYKSQVYSTPISYSSSLSAQGSVVISEIFNEIDLNGNGTLSLSEAEKLLIQLNHRLGRNYTERDAQAFFRALDVNRDGRISLREFREAFNRL